MMSSHSYEIHDLLRSGRVWADMTDGTHRKLIEDLTKANATILAAEAELGVMRDLLGLIADRTGGVIRLTEKEQRSMRRGRTVIASSDARNGVLSIEFVEASQDVGP